jgi:hypothetical protein
MHPTPTPGRKGWEHVYDSMTIPPDCQLEINNVLSTLTARDLVGAAPTRPPLGELTPGLLDPLCTPVIPLRDARGHGPPSVIPRRSEVFVSGVISM